MANSFDPIAASDARVLILGSIPGRRSIELGQYYGHGRNAFWPLMQELFGDGAQLDYPARVALMKRHHIAIWDVLASAVREGSSLDSAIQAGSEVPNDIAGLLDTHPAISHIFFNGAKAESAFNRHVRAKVALRRVELLRLPSTSPANAGASYTAKLSAWRAVAEAAQSSRA